MRPDEQPSAPSWQWRAASSFTMGAVGVLCRSFLLGVSKTEVHGLDSFLELLDEREDVESRDRGLITGKKHTHTHFSHNFLTYQSVSNHISVYVRSAATEQEARKADA